MREKKKKKKKALLSKICTRNPFLLNNETRLIKLLAIFKKKKNEKRKKKLNPMGFPKYVWAGLLINCSYKEHFIVRSKKFRFASFFSQWQRNWYNADIHGGVF